MLPPEVMGAKMSLSQAVARRLVHQRRVECQGFLREDGLWDIEGSMVDIKAEDTPSPGRPSGRVAAGEPFHLMRLRLTLDDSLLIHAVEACIESAPFHTCPGISQAYQKLVGTRIGPGWNRQIKELLGGVAGCTHLSELLLPLATTAFQTTWYARQNSGEAEASKRVLIDSCHTWSGAGEVVKTFLPEYYQGAAE